MLARNTYPSKEAWLAGRMDGLGASDAAAVCGLSNWQTPISLWKEKRGLVPSKDLSGNEAVERGNRLEPALRTMFQALHPELTVEYHQYDTLFQTERPWLFATLDGELLYPGQEGRRVLEIKTAMPKGRVGWELWDGRVPDNYYTQILHQLLSTKYDGAVLFAALFNQNGEVTLREYEFALADCETDMQWLLECETRFWGYRQSGQLPPMILTM